MKKIGVIFGGMSTENEVSKISGRSILENLNKDKYEIYPIFINKDGEWIEFNTNKKIGNIVEYIKKLDVVFPVLHGLNGEDGTIQGMLTLLKIPYVGCKVLASSIGMDKVYTKIIFEKARINQAKYIYIKKYKNTEYYIYVDENFNENQMKLTDISKIVKDKIGYPVFVKPSNSGSSVGVNKCKNDNELIKNIKIAAEFDYKILIEQEIIGHEVECAVIGNYETGIEASDVGEILSAEDFYTFNAKYNNKESKTLIPARITKKQSDEIKKMAIKAFKSIDGSGLSRVDFFVENKTNKIYINEINTMPGFTSISMYPKLMENYGIEYRELLDKLIEMAE